MDLGWTIIDTKGTDFPECLLDNSVARHACSAHHLNASVSDTEQRIRHGDLGHRAFGGAERSGVEHARAPVDHQFRLLQINEIVRQHEADAFMIDERLAKGMATAGIVRRDFVRAHRKPKPAHAMRQPGGAEADLRIGKAFTARAQHLVR